MPGPAFTLSPGMRTILFATVQASFLTYLALSFLVVAAFTLRLARQGRLLVHFDSLATYPPPRWMALYLAMSLFVLLEAPIFFPAVTLAGAGYLGAQDPAAFAQLGAGRLPLRRLAAWSLLVCGAVFFVELPLSWWLNEVMTWLRVPHPEQSTVLMFRGFTRWSDIVSFIVIAVFFMPLIEEIFFRGLLFNFLKGRLGLTMAILVSAAVFACAHENLGSIVQLWVLGVILAVAYQHTGSLLLPIAIHGCYNLITALSLLLEKGGP